MPAVSGFKITGFFHPTALVSDLTEVSEFYRRALGGPMTLTRAYEPGWQVYRAYRMIGDMWVEHLCPEQTHFTAYQALESTIGGHWVFPCFYIEDMQDCIHILHHHHRIRLHAAADGHPVIGLPDGTPERSLLFTNPRDTGIQWEFWEGDLPIVRDKDPRARPEWKLEEPLPSDPMGVEFGSHHTVAVRDRAITLNFLVSICGARVLSEGENSALGTLSTWVAVGTTPTIFEIAQPIDDCPALRDIERVGNTYHALNFKVRDLSRAADHLVKQGVGLEIKTKNLVVTDPTTCHGLRFGFVQDLHDQDPRR